MSARLPAKWWKLAHSGPLVKLKNAQEERRARITTVDGDVYYGETEDDIRFELGLDVELAYLEKGPRTEEEISAWFAQKRATPNEVLREERLARIREIAAEDEGAPSSCSPSFYLQVKFDIDANELPKGIDLDTMACIAIETLDREMPPSFVFEQLNVSYGAAEEEVAS
jgi:hypothetical protein